MLVLSLYDVIASAARSALCRIGAHGLTYIGQADLECGAGGPVLISVHSCLHCPHACWYDEAWDTFHSLSREQFQALRWAENTSQKCCRLVAEALERGKGTYKGDA